MSQEEQARKTSQVMPISDAPPSRKQDEVIPAKRKPTILTEGELDKVAGGTSRIDPCAFEYEQRRKDPCALEYEQRMEMLRRQSGGN